MTEITVSGLEKRWGGVVALAGIDFKAHAGELLVLLGPSGCGKSTTLRIIAGLEAASAGTIASATAASTRCLRHSGAFRWCFSPMHSTRI